MAFIPAAAWIAAATVTSTVVATASAAASAAAAKRQAQAAIDAAKMNASLADTEFSRQQQVTAQVAQEDLSDRQRKISQDLSMIRVSDSEGSGLGFRATEDAAYAYGLDISRIENNRNANLDALQSKKVAAATGASFAELQASNLEFTQSANANMNAIGSGVQIASNYAYRQQQLDIAKNSRANAE